MLVVAVVTLTFIITGQINTLAPIVTMPFLLTYACLDYAYFALAQTFDLRHTREQRFRTQSPTFDRNYGSASRNNSITDTDNDLDSLFPERIRHKNLMVRNCIHRSVHYYCNLFEPILKSYSVMFIHVYRETIVFPTITYMWIRHRASKTMLVFPMLVLRNERFTYTIN